MSLVYEKLSQALAANASWPLMIAGDFFRVEACDWPVTVALLQGGREIGRMTNIRGGDFVRDVKFDQVKIINGATAQTVTIQIAGGGIGSDRVIGEVSVIDGGRQVSLENRAFGSGATQAGAGGLYSLIQCYNPVGSGKNVYVKRLIASGPALFLLDVRTDSVALATLRWNLQSMKWAGAQSVAEIRTDTLAAVGGTRIGAAYCDANKPVDVKYENPIVLTPGSGVALVNLTLAGSLGAWFEATQD